MSKSVLPPRFTLKGLVCPARVVKVYDGDTCTLVFPYGGQDWRWPCRMAGYNCAEIRGETEAERAKAQLAKAELAQRVLGREVTVHCGDFDKYGRCLVELRVGDRDINAEMLQFGAKYSGRGEKEW